MLRKFKNYPVFPRKNKIDVHLNLNITTSVKKACLTQAGQKSQATHDALMTEWPNRSRPCSGETGRHFIDCGNI